MSAVLQRSAAPPEAPDPVERFGEIEVETSTRCIRRAGDEIPLAPEEFSLLIALLRRKGAVASRLELLQEVWGHRAANIQRALDQRSRVLTPEQCEKIPVDLRQAANRGQVRIGRE